MGLLFVVHQEAKLFKIHMCMKKMEHNLNANDIADLIFSKG